MTVWHDKPPLSRRQARDNARADAGAQVPLIEDDPAANIRPAMGRQPSVLPDSVDPSDTPDPVLSRRAASRRRVQWPANDQADGGAVRDGAPDVVPETTVPVAEDASGVDASGSDSSDEAGVGADSDVSAQGAQASEPPADEVPSSSPDNADATDQREFPATPPPRRFNRVRENRADRLASWFSRSTADKTAGSRRRVRSCHWKRAPRSCTSRRSSASIPRRNPGPLATVSGTRTGDGSS